MTTLQNLISACGADAGPLMAQARLHTADWARWLEPVSDSEPTGGDPGYDDDFQRIREEVNKLSGIDTGLICTLGEKLLTGVSKDVRVITFYIWARLHQDGERGLAEGLELLAAMLERFGSRLHPQRERSRKTALEWLGHSRITDSLSRYPEVDMPVMQRIAAALALADACFQAQAPAYRAVPGAGKPLGTERRGQQPGPADQPGRGRRFPAFPPGDEGGCFRARPA